jgi:hypothetical protein
MTPRLSLIHYRPSWRLVPSRFPPTDLFERVAAPEDMEIVNAIEGYTNDRLRVERGELALPSGEDRLEGPGTSPVMAAFTHLNPAGSRFSDGSYGLYYAAKTIRTAVEETRHHRARFLAATGEPPIEIDMRSYAVDIRTRLHDIRKQQQELGAIYDPNDYGAAQALAKGLHEQGSNGIAYSSVRDPDGECVAIFKPRLLGPVTQGEHYSYVWDGKRITHVYVKQLFV